MTHASKKTMVISTWLLLGFFYQLPAQTTYFAGTSAGTGNTGTYVTGVGYFALSSANSGGFNSAFGGYALQKNTTGTFNAAVGYYAMKNNTTGSNNISIGYSALVNNISGNYNTALGYSAVYNNTTGTDNIGVGGFALYASTTGSYNIAVGRDALYSNTTGTSNNAVGYTALRANTSGQGNTAMGGEALKSNTTGSYNTAVGYLAMNYNTTGAHNIAMGYMAARNNLGGINNAAFGTKALYNNTSGSNNISTGFNALYSNTTGNNNIAIGYLALEENTVSNNNIAMGYQSLFYNTGADNTAVGSNALYSNSLGNLNIAVGSSAMTSATNPSQAIAVGVSAFEKGSFTKSVGIGYKTGAGYFNGSTTFDPNLDRCVLIGDSISMQVAGLVSNSIAIGSQVKIDASNKVIIGNTSITSIGGQVGWTTYSDRRLKTNINKSKLGLDFIMALNPVTYNYKAEGQKGIVYTGLIAQEVDEAAKKTGAEFSGVDKNGEYWGIRYGELTVPLIKSVQELNDKTQAENEQLKLRIQKLEAAIELLEKRIKPPSTLSSSTLFQNQPNPFNQTSTISFKLSAEDKNAAIVIRDINGLVVKQLALSPTGKGSVTVNANELVSGTYTYSLLVNSNVVDTKLMVITK